jgi:hypothetical protein
MSAAEREQSTRAKLFSSPAADPQLDPHPRLPRPPLASSSARPRRLISPAGCATMTPIGVRSRADWFRHRIVRHRVIQRGRWGRPPEESITVNPTTEVAAPRPALPISSLTDLPSRPGTPAHGRGVVQPPSQRASPPDKRTGLAPIHTGIQPGPRRASVATPTGYRSQQAPDAVPPRQTEGARAPH